MANERPDHFDEEEPSHHEIIAIKYFYFESKARIYAARLEEEGIPTFVSNTNSITTVPIGNAGIGLHIREIDRETARAIIIRMDQRSEMELNEDESFRDADLGDIAYQRQLHEQKQGGNKIAQYIIAAIIFLILIRMVWRALHPEKAWDFF